MLRPCCSVLAVALWLVACGGGSGDGGSAAGPAPVSWTRFEGQVLAPDSTTPEAGARVSLVRIDAQGEPVAELGSATADPQGRFILDLPAGVAAGADLALWHVGAAGHRWRAPGLYPDVVLGAASEAAWQVLLEARQRLGRPFTEELPRLGRFARNVWLMLELVPPPAEARAPGALADRLKRWLRYDLATGLVLQQLGSSGRLPPSLGDIGALLGAARGATLLATADETTAEVRISTPADASGLRWTARTFASDATGDLEQTVEMRTVDDRLSADSTLTGEGATEELLRRFGPHVIGTFDLGFGTTHRLAALRLQDASAAPNGAVLTQETRYDITQTAVGIEAIEVFGKPLRALRIDFTRVLSIETTGIGRYEVHERSSRWSIPFAGVVRERRVTTLASPDGSAEEIALDLTAQGAVANDVSWPGGLRVRAEPVALPDPAGEQIVLRAASADGQLLLSSSDLTGNVLNLHARRIGQPDAARDAAIPIHDGGDRPLAVGILAVSADGTKLYLARDRLDAASASGADKDEATAAAQGATIYRFDAHSLAQEAALTLPPIASKTRPGRFFARFSARHLNVSPTDPLRFAVSGVDAVVGQGDVIGAQGFGNLDGFHERPIFDGGATLLGEQTHLRGWSPDGQSVWLELNGGGPTGLVHIVPFDEAGFLVGGRRDGMSTLDHFAQGLTPIEPFDRITADRAYYKRCSVLLDASTGAIVVDRRAHPVTSLRSAPCAERERRLLCLDGETVLELTEPNLAALRGWTVQNELRALAGSQRIGGPLHENPMFAPGPDMLLMVGARAVPGQAFTVVRVELD